ncbi:conserved protein of unknown function [Pseudorhizobium banfieldiae]|uniref:Capsule synthesis protein CapA domain-containing protein n=1 Tax=Pseudorhizobium banfieldiae TaxID=1125847 RepID=L0NIU8_9HYPH|nr:CapA family protein [arsenite-oxidising bacterium NT-25]CCF20809.1 conserved protein of unknown function [Pseudorhizobium banfieldiae]
MHPANVPCLTAARIDCCVLANNHIADWGLEGLSQTLRHLADVGVATVGAGDDDQAARRPALLSTAAGRRLMVFAIACPSAGVPRRWAATPQRPGVHLLNDFSRASVKRVLDQISNLRRNDDVVVVSIHWGPNWGYDIPAGHVEFAHALIDEADVNVVHGHSSHHPMGLEIYRNRLILFGCGDFINDYEGLPGYEEMRPELALGSVMDIDERGDLLRGVQMLPFRRKKFRLQRASQQEADWQVDVMSRESVGCRISLDDDGILIGVNAG